MRLILFFAIIIMSGCSIDKTYEINGKLIDEKYLLWEFASKLEMYEYEMSGFDFKKHGSQKLNSSDFKNTSEPYHVDEHHHDSNHNHEH